MDVDRKRALEGQVDADGLIDGIARRHDDQEIDITLRVRPAVGVGAEQDDLVGVEPFGNLANKAPDRRQRDVGRAVAVRLDVGPRGRSLLDHGAVAAVPTSRGGNLPACGTALEMNDPG